MASFRETFPESVNWHPDVQNAVASSYLEGRVSVTQEHIDFLHDIVYGRRTADEVVAIYKKRYTNKSY